jgi:hypothetical protein
MVLEVLAALVERFAHRLAGDERLSGVWYRSDLIAPVGEKVVDHVADEVAGRLGCGSGLRGCGG